MKKLLPYFLLLFFPLVSFGQAKNYRALADTAFNRHEYYTAAYYYKHIADGTTDEPKSSLPRSSAVKKSVQKRLRLINTLFIAWPNHIVCIKIILMLPYGMPNWLRKHQLLNIR
ncbi:hypothetical protein ACRQ5D_10545 [Mucilaginibacter sp. P25]|uniref:hypothetical protein n=1 Tax=Mucilaginibacter sp. P25 TaxID=3423945 RepID=UPI003D7A8CA5